MMTMEMMRTDDLNDAELVTASLGGNREAFRQIVERYQTLIASIAYCATGNMSQSEDLAQETFVAAWRQLPELREPAKLRSWLCRIVRFRVSKEFRRLDREPIYTAETLDAADATAAPEPLPHDQVISEEEKAILWRSLERIPEIYREPLVLFYREHQSIKLVADGLDLSEDAVKQRLARGRKLLQEEVQAFVESALGRTGPNQTFSGAVLAALPLAAGPAAGASAGLGAKGATVAKSGSLGVWLVPLAPFLGIAAGIIAQWLVIRDSTAERNLRIKKLAYVLGGWIAYLGSAVIGESGMHALARHLGWSPQIHFVAMVGFWWFYAIASVTLIITVIRRIQAVRRLREESGEVPPCPAKPMKPSTLAVVVAGAHLAMFSWLISLAWKAADHGGAAFAAGTMLVLGIWSFFRVHGKTGKAVERGFGRSLLVAGGMVLLILNLRAGVWVALHYRVSLAEAYNVQPLWIVHALTLALFVWMGIILALTKAAHSFSRTCSPNGNRRRV